MMNDGVMGMRDTLHKCAEFNVILRIYIQRKREREKEKKAAGAFLLKTAREKVCNLIERLREEKRGGESFFN